MILTIAEGSTGYYYVDPDGRVYTQHSYHVQETGIPGEESRTFVRPGERPDERRHQQFGGATPFWLPTGQKEELNSGQRLLLGDARADLDRVYELAEGTESEICPECGGVALRDYRLVFNSRIPFICENRHITIDESEAPVSSKGMVQVH